MELYFFSCFAQAVNKESDNRKRTVFTAYIITFTQFNVINTKLPHQESKIKKILTNYGINSIVFDEKNLILDRSSGFTGEREWKSGWIQLI